RPIDWLSPDRANERNIFEKILAPNAGIAPGWKNWILEHRPYFFYRFPQPRKDEANRNYYNAAASDWLRGRVIGKVTLHEGQTVVRMQAVDGKVAVTISDGAQVGADHVILASARSRIAMIPYYRPEISATFAIEATAGKKEA